MRYDFCNRRIAYDTFVPITGELYAFSFESIYYYAVFNEWELPN